MKIYFGLFSIILLVVMIGYTAKFLSDRSNHHSPIVSSQKSSPKTPDNLPPLSLDQIFNSNHNLPSNLDQSKLIKLIVTGDVIPARVVNIETIKRSDFSWPYQKVADLLRSGDLTFINLETPLIKDCPQINSGFTFCGSAQNIKGLEFAGVDVANLANNHAGNFGQDGINQTINLLKSSNIQAVGANNNPAFLTVKGTKFAFLGYNDIGVSPVVSSASAEVIKREVTEAKKQADVVIVQYHWGIEYQAQPSQRQIELGHQTIDDGADLVIGNHPHWIEPIEFYKGKLITYAHGNFVFDQMWSQKTREGVVGIYTFYDQKLIDVEYLPIEIEDYGQPQLLTGDHKNQILADFYHQSQVLQASLSAQKPKL